MFLAKVAQKFMRESFTGWDVASGTFTGPQFSGRMAQVDRFLSIYNRPTRMRQVLLAPGTELPPSLIFRHDGTGEVYIAGSARSDTRFDINDGSPYETIVMAHEVTPNGRGTIGLATHHRRAPTGPPSEPGWYVSSQLDSVYVDLEYRTSASQEGVYDARISDFYAWAPVNAPIQELDTLTLDGREYRVTDLYTDMGFLGLKLQQDLDPRVDLYVVTSERGVWNATSHQYDSVETKHEVTAIVSGQREQAVWNKLENSIQVVIDFAAIGFVPETNMKVELDGIRRTIKNVFTSVGAKQYELMVV